MIKGFSKSDIDKALQEAAYYYSSITDYKKGYTAAINEIKKERQNLREHIDNILKIRVSDEKKEYDSLQKQVLRLRNIGRFRNKEENERLNELENEIKNIEEELTSSCFNVLTAENAMTSDAVLKLDFENIKRTLCIDIFSVVRDGSFYNDDINTFVDVPLIIRNTNEKYSYPLNEEDSRIFLNYARGIFERISSEHYLGLLSKPKLYTYLMEDYRKPLKETEENLKQIKKKYSITGKDIKK